MKIHYKDINWQGKELAVIKDAGDFFVEQILFKRPDKKICLEHQPEVVARSIGRLLDVLLNKGIIGPEDFHEIADTDWPLRTQCKITPNQ